MMILSPCLVCLFVINVEMFFQNNLSFKYIFVKNNFGMTAFVLIQLYSVAEDFPANIGSHICGIYCEACGADTYMALHERPSMYGTGSCLISFLFIGVCSSIPLLSNLLVYSVIGQL